MAKGTHRHDSHKQWLNMNKRGMKSKQKTLISITKFAPTTFDFILKYPYGTPKVITILSI